MVGIKNCYFSHYLTFNYDLLTGGTEKNQTLLPLLNFFFYTTNSVPLLALNSDHAGVTSPPLMLNLFKFQFPHLNFLCSNTKELFRKSFTVKPHKCSLVALKNVQSVKS